MGGSNSETPVEESTQDPYKALVTYRARPLESGISPAELLMGRKICTRVPTLPMQLKPSWSYLEQFREKDASLKARQKNNFGRGHSAKSLSSLSWRTCLATRPVGWKKTGTPRSYIVETPGGKLRRNDCHLHPLLETPKTDPQGDRTVPSQTSSA